MNKSMLKLRLVPGLVAMLVVMQPAIVMADVAAAPAPRVAQVLRAGDASCEADTTDNLSVAGNALMAEFNKDAQLVEQNVAAWYGKVDGTTWSAGLLTTAALLAAYHYVYVAK